MKTNLNMGNVLEQYKSKNFNKLQLIEIYKGYEQGLSEKLVNIYAKEYFRHQQQNIIRIALRSYDDLNKIRLLANPIFDENQMWQIYCGIYDELSIQELKEYADYTLSPSDMANKRIEIKQRRYHMVPERI